MFFESSKAEGGRGHYNQLPTTWRMDGWKALIFFVSIFFVFFCGWIEGLKFFFLVEGWMRTGGGFDFLVPVF